MMKQKIKILVKIAACKLSQTNMTSLKHLKTLFLTKLFEYLGSSMSINPELHNIIIEHEIAN